MNYKAKTSGASLQYVLVLSFFILTLLSGFVGWVYFTSRIKIESSQQIEKEKSNRNLLLRSAKGSSPLNGDEKKFFSQEYQNGLFQVFVRNENGIKNAAFVGCKPIYSDVSLYLSDRGNTLYLGTNASISQKIFAPSTGIRMTTSGSQGARKIHSYSIERSETILPTLDFFFLKSLDSIVRPNLWKPSTEILTQKKLSNSFFEKQIRIEVNEPTTLSDIELIGNIWLRSTAPITISSSVKIVDVIISAPTIIFEKGFKGQLQAFASERIEVGVDCHFTYPSVLWVQTIPSIIARLDTQLISISENVKLSGFVGMYKENLDPLSVPKIYIKPTANINGIIYCSGALALEGKVWGTVFTNDLIFQDEGVLYKNHFVNGEIDVGKRSYASLDFCFNKKGTKKVIQWLY